MKISILVVITMSLMSLSAMANETNCEPLQLMGKKKVSVEFKRFESGRTTSDDASDLLAGDELLSVVMPVPPNEDLTWVEANEITNRSFKIISTELMFKGVYKSGVKFYELDALIEIPQEIADKYNLGNNEGVISCIETISCYGMDC